MGENVHICSNANLDHIVCVFGLRKSDEIVHTMIVLKMDKLNFEQSSFVDADKVIMFVKRKALRQQKLFGTKIIATLQLKQSYNGLNWSRWFGGSSNASGKYRLSISILLFRRPCQIHRDHKRNQMAHWHLISVNWVPPTGNSWGQTLDHSLP